MDSSLITVMVGLFASIVTLGFAYFTLRQAASRDVVLFSQTSAQLLQAASKETVSMLERRVQMLEDENKDLRQKVEACGNHSDILAAQNDELMKTNYDLMQRLLAAGSSATQSRRSTRRTTSD